MGHAVFDIFVILVGAGFLVMAIGKARAMGAPAVTASGKRGRNGGRAVVRTPSARDTAKTIWTQARATDWLETRRHHRENGTSPPPGKAIRAARATGRGARKLRGAFSRPPEQGADGTSPPPAPATVTLKPPPPPAPASPGTNGQSNGRQPTMASTTSAGSAEKLIEGVNQVHAEASAGGIHAKHSGIKSCTEGSLRFSAMASMLSRAMSEPGSNYGPEITEPLAKAATHLQAAAMAFSESDGALTTLINMSVGDLANSARQAPHHTELSESGSH
jgi:hypothetical protein